MRRAADLDERGHGLSFVRSESRDIDKPRHAGLVAGLGDHHPAIRVANKDDGPVLGREDALRGHDVVG